MPLSISIAEYDQEYSGRQNIFSRRSFNLLRWVNIVNTDIVSMKLNYPEYNNFDDT